MNQILQLKGQFQQKKNNTAPGPRNLPVDTFVTIDHIKELEQQLISIRDYWLNDLIIQGALVSVYYNKIVAKSNRLQGMLGQGSGDPSETICGSRFSDDYPIRHIFTHYVQLRDIDEAIRKLDQARTFIKSKFGRRITHGELKAINEKTITYTNRALAQTNFSKVVVDCYYVQKFDIDRNPEPLTETAIITIYKTNVKTKELFTKLGINMIDAKMIDETTIRLSSDELQILREKAPYLIAMQTNDL